MNSLSLQNLAVVALATLVIACSSPRGQFVSTPIPGSPSAARMELEPASRAVLERDGLRGEFRRNPDAALKALHDRHKQAGGANRLVALAELCGSLGSEQAAKDPARAAGYFLEAARLSRAGAIRGGSGPDGQLRLIYNDACSGLATVLHQEGHDGKKSLRFAGPLTPFRLALDRSEKGAIDPTFFDDHIPADHLELQHGDLPRFRQDGIGGALVAHHPPRGHGKGKQFESSAGIALPVNAALEFPGPGEARLRLRNLMKVDHIRIAGRSVPLAADWSAPMVYMYQYAPTVKTGFEALLHPAEFDAETDIYEVGLFDPDKIPVVFVHGLMSSPSTWITMINTLWSDPVVRKYYQAVVFRYPSGYPIPRNAASLRADLQSYRRVYDTPRSRPQMRRMVMVGHSMGGNLTSVQIRSSGNAIRELYLERPISDLDLPPAEQDALRNMMVFEADPDIERAVFIAAPHLGSEIATNPIGRLGSRLIKLPGNLMNLGISAGQLVGLKGLTPIAQEDLKSHPDSIKNLQPHAPFLTEVRKLPVSKRVTYHSIIGRANPEDPIPESTDKVVPYWSSHLDGAASEKIVHAKHTTITGNADAIEETRRLLYLHLGRKIQKDP